MTLLAVRSLFCRWHCGMSACKTVFDELQCGARSFTTSLALHGQRDRRTKKGKVSCGQRCQVVCGVGTTTPPTWLLPELMFADQALSVSLLYFLPIVCCLSSSICGPNMAQSTASPSNVYCGVPISPAVCKGTNVSTVCMHDQPYVAGLNPVTTHALTWMLLWHATAVERDLWQVQASTVCYH